MTCQPTDWGKERGCLAQIKDKAPRKDASSVRERHDAAERRALVDAGESIFREIIKGFERVIRENASEARVEASNNQLTITMGQATLSLELPGAVPPNIVLGSGMWTVAAIGLIRVHQSKPEWNHGATLWYMRSRQSTEFRWYEISYQKHALSGGPLVGPSPIQDLGNDIYRHASMAAGPGMHVFVVDFGPAPIDDENQDSFFQRWLERLVKSYNGRLCPF